MPLPPRLCAMRRRGFKVLVLLAAAAPVAARAVGLSAAEASVLEGKDSCGGLSLLQHRATARVGLEASAAGDAAQAAGGAARDAARDIKLLAVSRPSAPPRTLADDWDSPLLWSQPPGPQESKSFVPASRNGRFRSDPDFTRDWAVTCLSQDPNTNTASYHMKRWMGRLGNNIVQILNVMSIAACSGLESFQMVLLPVDPIIQIYQFFPSLPQVLGLPSSWRPSSCECAVCANRKLCDTFFAHCSTTVQERRALIRELIEPHIANEADCGRMPADPSAQDLLTIHIRSGDVSTALSHDHAQPPCVFYEEVVRRGFWVNDYVWRPYSRVLVVTEDTQHPCLPHMQQGLAGVPVEVQTGTLFQDWCSLVTAQHLALSHSEFSTTAIFFNRVLRSLHQLTLGTDPEVRKWSPCKKQLVESYMQSNVFQLCEAFEPNARVMFYDFPRDGFSDAGEYFWNYPLSNAKIFGCDGRAA